MACAITSTRKVTTYEIDLMSRNQFRYYQGNPVKRLRHGKLNNKYGLVLTYLSPQAGTPGKRIVITQSDWDTHGEWRDVASSKVADIRKGMATAS